MELLMKIGKFLWTLSVGPHDFADRLNYRYTCGLLVTFSGILSVKLYVFKPIQVCS